MVTQDPRKYRYHVDADDVLVGVDSWWLAFARENGAAELTEEALIGRSLWDFVAGDDTRQFYRGLHARVRTSAEPKIISFRCDSPGLQRHMRLKITKDKDQLVYESQLVRVEPRRCLKLLDSLQPHSDAVLTICSVCMRALIEPTGWLDVEDISVRLALDEKQQVPRLRHTICPRCATALAP